MKTVFTGREELGLITGILPDGFGLLLTGLMTHQSHGIYPLKKVEYQANIEAKMWHMPDVFVI